MNALKCLLEAFQWINRKGIKRYVWIPLFINIVLFIIGGWVLAHYFSSLMDRFLPQDSWLSYLSFILWPLFGIMFVIIFFYMFSLVANIVGAPFNAYLSEKVQKLETGEAPESDRTIIQEVVVAVGEEIKKTLFFLIWMIPIIIVSFIPVINFIAPLLWFVYAAWSAYLQYMDYPMGNNGYLFVQQRQILAKRKDNYFTFGGLATIMLMIPILNVFAMPVCVIGATLHWCRNVKTKP